MAKPVGMLFGWISSGAAVTEPSNTRKTAGYQVRGKLPNSHLNRQLVKLTAWIDGYLDVLDTQTFVWLVRHFFDEGIQLGGSLVADIYDALTERIDMLIAPAAESERTLLWTTRLGSGGPAIRFWAHNPSDGAKSLEITVNAVWTGTWAKDDNAGSAVLFILGQDPARFRMAVKPADEDTAWAHTFGTSGGWTTLAAQFAGPGYGYSPLIAGVLGLESAVISGALAVGGAMTATAGLTVTGAAFDAATGADRAEHRADLADYLGGAGTTALHFAHADAVAAAIKDRLFRIGNGTVTGLSVQLEVATSADLTVEVIRTAPGPVVTVLGSVTVAAGLVHDVAVFTTGNAYTVFDYLGLRVKTAGSATISSCDIGAMIRTVE